MSRNKSESNSALKVLSIAVGDKYNMIIVDHFGQDKSDAQDAAGKAHAEVHDTEREHKEHDHRTEVSKPMSSQWILARKMFSLHNLLEDSNFDSKLEFQRLGLGAVCGDTDCNRPWRSCVWRHRLQQALAQLPGEYGTGVLSLGVDCSRWAPPALIAALLPRN